MLPLMLMGFALYRKYVLAAIRLVWETLLEFGDNYLAKYLDPIVDWFPDLSLQIGFVCKVAGIANQFIALDYALFLLGAYFVFALSLAVCNWILGLIPTIN